MQFIPFPEAINVRNDRLLVRTAFEAVNSNKKKSAAQLKNEKNLKNNYPAGFINRKIRLRMSKIIYNWMEAVNSANEKGKNKTKRQFTFVTLTLPAKQIHTDKELHAQALNPFIATLKRKHGLINYLWRAERQKNGNLHYHLLCDTFINWEKIRKLWNSTMDNLGYIEAYRQNMISHHSSGFRLFENASPKWTREKQYKAYLQGIATNWSNPNSTDIHSLYSINDVGSYIMKYVSKSTETDTLDKKKKAFHEGTLTEEQYKNAKATIEINMQKFKIEARVWECGDEIKELKDFSLIECVEMYKLIDAVKEDEKTKAVIKDEVKIFYCKNLKHHIKKIPLIKKLFTRHHLAQYKLIHHSKLYSPPLPHHLAEVGGMGIGLPASVSLSSSLSVSQALLF